MRREDLFDRVPEIGDTIAWSGDQTSMRKGRIIKFSRIGNPIVSIGVYSRGREITDYPRGQYVIVKNL